MSPRDRRAELGNVDTSRACRGDEHGECAHLATVGGGFNPRRLRLEFGAGLCPCTCHASCPATAALGNRLTVPPRRWRESCTCPGAERQRRVLDEAGIEVPDFGEMWDDARRRSRARKEAFEAARAQAAGRSRDEIRGIYVTELTARGLPLPREDVLDAVVDRIAGNPLPAVRMAAASLVQVGKALTDLSRTFRSRS